MILEFATLTLAYLMITSGITLGAMYFAELLGINTNILKYGETIANAPEDIIARMSNAEFDQETNREKSIRRRIRHELYTISAVILMISLVASFITYQFQQREIEEADATALPIVTANIPAEANIGETIQAEFTFNNIGTSEGYAPFIDIILPVIGNDGAGLIEDDDGISLGGNANYEGIGLTTSSFTFPEIDTFSCPVGLSGVEHPYSRNTLNEPEVICGVPGNALVVIDLPFGSFVDTQPTATISVPLNISNLADLGVPLDIEYRGGFRFGNDPLDNPATDPTILGGFAASQLSPSVFTQSKSYQGPEGETATGPNYTRTYTIIADIADGQTVNDLTISDFLPNNVVYLSHTTTPASTDVTVPAAGIAHNAPDNELTVNFGTVVGSSGSNDAEMVITFYVPHTDADGQEVINSNSGNDVTITNDSAAGGSWVPIDTRDVATPVTSNTTTNDAQFTAKSIATQKSVTNLTGGQNRPGDTLQYTVNFQISDYFTFDNLSLTDIMSDGQTWDSTFAPTLSVNEGSSLSTGPIDISNYTVNKETGFVGASGNTTVVFDISNELLTRTLNTRVEGGCITNVDLDNCITNNGASTGQLVYRVTINDQFTDDYDPGDPSVSIGDFITNQVSVEGTVLENLIWTPNDTEADGSSTRTNISRGGIQKSIYALNGVVGTYTSPELSPGDVVTYRLEYFLDLSDVESFYLEDFLPLPTLDADNISTVFDSTVDATPPAANSAKFGPTESFFGLSGMIPSVSINSGPNTVMFDYGNFQDASNQTTKVDILLSVQANDEPFANNLKIVNQVQGNASNTFSEAVTDTSIIPITLKLPELELTKGVVATDNTNGIFDPVTAAPVAFNAPATSCNRFSGTIHSQDIATTPIDSNLTDVDGNDIVTFATVIENTGSAEKGAFNLQVNDVLPVGLTPAGGTGNLCVSRGDGTPLTYSAVDGTDTNPFFEDGIEIDDFSALEGSIAAYDELNPTTGDNIIVITYDVQIDPSITTSTALLNTSNILNYTGSEFGTTSFVPSAGIFDEATITTADLVANKDLTSTDFAGTSGNDVVVGEVITYTADITIPQGVTNNLTITDQLDAGLAYIDTVSVIGDADISTDVAGSFAAVATSPTITNNGRTIEWDLGTVTNVNNDNLVDDVVTFVYRAVVVNDTNAVSGANLNNSINATYDNTGTPFTILEANAPNATVLEPDLNVTKSSNNAGGDAGDSITFTIVVEHSGTSETDAYDVEFEDILDGNYIYTPGSFQNTGGVAPDTISDTGGIFAATWSQLNLGQSSTFTFEATVDDGVVPNEVVPNTAEVEWTSLPGDVSTPISSFNPDSVERTGDPADPGSNNDYTDSDDANFTVDNVVVSKSIDSTSEAFTGTAGGFERFAVGEIVRYRLVTEVPEGTIPGFRIVDQLPNRLRFLDDGTSTVGFSSNGGLTSDDAAFAACNQVGSDNTIEPGCSIPNANITNSSFGDGTDPVIELGTIINVDNDADAEYISSN